MRIREERPRDYYPIQRLLERAFAGPHNTEARIVGGLRFVDSLSLSLVAVKRGEVVGQIAISPVTMAGHDVGWKAICPISVAPEHRGRGIGSALVREALEQLKRTGTAGCVVVGASGFFARFGFKPSLRIRHQRIPWPEFQALSFNAGSEEGEIEYHPIFDIIMRP